MATPKGTTTAAEAEKVVGERGGRYRDPDPPYTEIRFRCSRSLRAAIEREAASEHMTKAAFVRACVVRILRARSH
jgi:hypothetical protein